MPSVPVLPRRRHLPAFAAAGLIGPALFLVAAPPAAAQYAFRDVADSSMTAPGGGNYSFGGNIRANVSINNAGAVAFQAGSVYRNDGTTTTRVIASGTAAPGGGTFIQLYNPVIGDGGHVAVLGRFAGGLDFAYYRVDPSGASIVRLGGTWQAAPGGGTYQSLDFGGFTPSVNASGSVAFWGDTDLSASNLYVSDGETAARIGARNDALPGGGTVNKFDEPHLNDSGQVAYFTTMNGGPALGVYLYNGAGGTTTRIAATGDVAPGGGTFSLLGTTSMNDLGAVAFHSTTTGGPADALYRYSGGVLTRIAALGDPALAAGSPTGIWGWNTINNNGLTAFATRTGANTTTVIQGIYTGDGTTTAKVVALGDALFGSTVTNLGLNKQSLNDAGQVAFNFTLQDGRSGVAVATPQAAAAVPEPGTLALASFPILALAAVRTVRRRRR
jgi:hypothetical protein